MEEQGATARQANAANGGSVDDENSQAEGSNVEGAVGFSSNEANMQQNLQPNHPHYENIYESIEHYNAAAACGVVAGGVAVAPADVDGNNKLGHQPQVTDANVNQPNQNVALSNNNNNHNQQQHALSNITARNELYDRTNTNSPAYDVPRSVHSSLGFRRNFQLDIQGANRFNASRCNIGGVSCQRQRSFDDTESHNYYNFNYHHPTLRYENIYEQIRDEPINHNIGAGANVYGRLNVIGHGIGRIERHLSSSCGNIDHYNLGGHYAVLGHSQFGTVGHIRLNAGGAGVAVNHVVGNKGASAESSGIPAATVIGPGIPAQRDTNYVKNSSSFFSCLHGENSQSMKNIHRASGAGATTAVGVGAVDSQCGGVANGEHEQRSSSAGPLTICGNNNMAAIINDTLSPSTNSRNTGAIPKIKVLNANASKNSTQHVNTEKLLPVKNAITKKTSNSNAAKPTPVKLNVNRPENPNSALNRISKSSLQWLLVNKWLPLWIGQGPDCKVIDFNFMFSRDCADCDADDATAQIADSYETQRIGGTIPQDVVRINARAEVHAPCSTAANLRQDFYGRPVHSALNRVREAEQPITNSNNRRDSVAAATTYRYENPSYENVHVQWHNGFEFGRSRDYELNYSPQRPQLHYTRSKSQQKSTQLRHANTSAKTTSTAKYCDPFRNYELNSENNTFKPKLAKIDNVENMHTVSSQSAPNDLDLEGAVGGVNSREIKGSDESNTADTNTSDVASDLNDETDTIKTTIGSKGKSGNNQ